LFDGTNLSIVLTPVTSDQANLPDLLPTIQIVFSFKKPGERKSIRKELTLDLDAKVEEMAKEDDGRPIVFDFPCSSRLGDAFTSGAQTFIKAVYRDGEDEHLLYSLACEAYVAPSTGNSIYAHVSDQRLRS
jgi:hypothetical protein